MRKGVPNIHSVCLLLGMLIFFSACGGDPTGPGEGNEGTKNELSISSISPKKGPPGTVVTIEGKNFSTKKSENFVEFGDRKAMVNSATSSEEKIVVPNDLEAGEVSVRITVNDKTTTAFDKFTVTEPKEISINKLISTEGEAGSTVYIEGVNFSPTASQDTVRFGDTVASVVSATSTRLVVTVPEGLPAGKVAVRVTVGYQTVEAPDQFEVMDLHYTSDYPYNLNVVYFVPNDVMPRPQYKKRISEILLDIRAFYGKWMNHWGYGDRTFGLLTDQDHQRIKFTVINGDKPHTAYLNDGGGGAEKTEIEAYFRYNPNEKTSDHYLVITPTTGYGVPYYGLGFGWAFIADIEGMNLDVLETGGNNLYIGGTAHELGHGLNLPHDSYKVSEQNKHGMALMDSGNYSYGEEPTFLTRASCAILDKNQIFSKTEGSFYDVVNASLKKLSGHFKNGDIIIDGKFKTDSPVSTIIVYNDPEGRSTYNAVPWTTTPISADSFHVQMPVNELPDHSNKSYSLYIRFVFENGSVHTFSGSNYEFSNGKPDINFQYGARPVYSRTDWQISGYSDQEEGHDRLAKHVLDGDYDTFWHSRWSGVNQAPDHPHSITIDMSKKQAVHGFQFVQRQGGRRNIKDMTIKVSDDGSNWKKLGDYQLAHTSLAQSVDLESEHQFRYFKIITHSAWDGEVFAALAEVGVY